MPEDISLLPKEVKKRREEETRSKLLRKISLVLLAASIFFAFVVFIYSLSLKSQLSNLDKSIGSEKSKVESLSEIESDAHDLEVRVNALKSVFEERAYFSKLLINLSQAVPADVSITEMTVPSAEAASVSGTSRGYVSLAKFLLNLKEDELFGTVELKSVSLDSQTGEANFDLSLGIVKGGLAL